MFIFIPTDSMVRTNSACNYSIAEVNNLLSRLEEFLPIGSEEWNRTIALHNDDCKNMKGFHPRDRPSISRKFTSLCKKKAPTGNPNIAPEVRWAKKVKHLIGQKANVGDGEDVFDIESGQVVDSLNGDGVLNINPKSNDEATAKATAVDTSPVAVAGNTDTSPAAVAVDTDTSPAAVAVGTSPPLPKTRPTVSPPPPETALTATATSSITPSTPLVTPSITPSMKRSYNSTVKVQTDFLQAYQAQLQAQLAQAELLRKDRLEQEERDRKRREEKEDKMFTAMMSLGQTLAVALAGAVTGNSNSNSADGNSNSADGNGNSNKRQREEEE